MHTAGTWPIANAARRITTAWAPGSAIFLSLSLKYKFWAVNAVAFVISLMLVLFALHTEQQARSADAKQAAIAQARLLQQWPQQAALPSSSNIQVGNGSLPGAQGGPDASGWQAVQHDARLGDSPVIGAQRVTLSDGRTLAVMARAPSLLDLFAQHALTYAVAVAVLMLLLLAASQLLIRFLLSHLNTLKDVILQAERSGDLSLRVPLSSRDEVGQMAAAFNAMQAGYQRVVGTVGQVADELNSGTRDMAERMGRCVRACSASKVKPIRLPPRSTRCRRPCSISPITLVPPAISRSMPIS